MYWCVSSSIMAAVRLVPDVFQRRRKGDPGHNVLCRSNVSRAPAPNILCCQKRGPVSHVSSDPLRNVQPTDELISSTGQCQTQDTKECCTDYAASSSLFDRVIRLAGPLFPVAGLFTYSSKASNLFYATVSWNALKDTKYRGYYGTTKEVTTSTMKSCQR